MATVQHDDGDVVVWRSETWLNLICFRRGAVFYLCWKDTTGDNAKLAHTVSGGTDKDDDTVGGGGGPSEHPVVGVEQQDGLERCEALPRPDIWELTGQRVADLPVMPATWSPRSDPRDIRFYLDGSLLTTCYKPFSDGYPLDAKLLFVAPPGLQALVGALPPAVSG